MDPIGKKICWDIAKQSALICIDEKISEFNDYGFNNDRIMDDEIIWQNRIKQELNKL